MAKVLQNFLIGVGLDTEKYDLGAKGVESSLGRMRTLVGFTGAAITGAFAAAGGAAIASASRVDEINLATEKFRTSVQYVNDYGNALRALGGNADEAYAAIATMEAAIAARQYSADGLMPGEVELARAGVDTTRLRYADSGDEMLRELASQIPSLNVEQQRVVQDTLGLSDAVMRSLRGGAQELDAAVARASQLYGEFGRATEAAREYNRTLTELNTQFEGIGETLAEKMLPAFTGVLQSVSGFIADNQQAISAAGDIAAKSPAGASIATGGVAAAAAGAGLQSIGLKAAGGALMRAGVPGMAIGAGMMAWDVRPDDIEGLTGLRPSDYAFDNTPLDAARDAYNAVADKYGFERSEKGAGAISYLEGSYDRFDKQISDFDAVLREYAETGGRNRQAERVAAPQAEYLPLNQVNYHEGEPRQIVESATSGFVTQPDPYPVEVENVYDPIVNVQAPDGPVLVPMPDPYPVEGNEKYPQPIFSPNVEVPDAPQPVYFGGEVTNIEAAQASPEIIMLNDSRLQSEKSPAAQRISVDNNLDIQLEIDGRAIDTRVVDVIERRERDTIDDIYSSVDR